MVLLPQTSPEEYAPSSRVSNEVTVCTAGRHHTRLLAVRFVKMPRQLATATMPAPVSRWSLQNTDTTAAISILTGTHTV